MAWVVKVASSASRNCRTRHVIRQPSILTSIKPTVTARVQCASSSLVHDKGSGQQTDFTTISNSTLFDVNSQLTNDEQGRLFAVVHFLGHQFKITTDDLLLVKTGPTFPDVGERIVIHKVLMAGSKDFSLIGRPLLSNVRVEATVIEKTLGYAKSWYLFKRRKNVRKLQLVQDLQTVVRINSIEMRPIDDEVD